MLTSRALRTAVAIVGCAALAAGAAPVVAASAPTSHSRLETPPATQRVHARTFDSSVSAEVAPEGTATFTSPTLDKKTTKVTLTVSAEDEEEAEFTRIAMFLTQQRLSKKGKLLTCLRMHQLALQGWRSTLVDYSIDLASSEKALLTFVTCMHIARLVEIIESEEPRTAARAARPPCAVQPAAFPMRVKRTASGVTVSGTGKGKAPRKGGPLKVACRKVGSSMVLTVRPRAKGKSLRSVVGNKVSIGVQSPLGSTDSTTVTVSFAK